MAVQSSHSTITRLCCILVVMLACCSLIFWYTFMTADIGQKKSEILHGLPNPVFDYEALLGAYKREELVELPQNVRISRLRRLAKSHDANNNDVIEKHELKEWILESYKLMDHEESKVKLEDEDMNGDGRVSVWEIIQKTYGYSEDEVTNLKMTENNAGVLQLIDQAKQRFTAADVNRDGLLNETEHLAYFQPHYFPHMQNIEVESILSKLDNDGDRHVSLQEFKRGSFGDELQDFEVKTFKNLDRDKNGKLSPDELRPWAVPDDDDVAADEAEHLISLCDEDKNGYLSISEIVSKEDEFIRSTATVYGRSLHFVKDEL